MISKNSKIAVIGAGAWGTAIANLVAKNLFQTFLITNNKENLAEIKKTRINEKYLPKVKLSNNLEIIFGITENNLKEVDFIFIVTPSQAVEKVFKEISSLKLKKDVKFVICSKGLDGQKLKFFSQIFSDVLPKYKFAVLSGPNFAIEVGLEVPTVTTIASKNKVLAKEVIKILNNKYFLAEYSKDVMTTEISAVLKNVMAIGCGIVDGLELGQNAKAALVKKGIDEIILLCEKLKSKGDLANSAGFGDIFLTCSSVKSRNNLLGFEIAKGKTYSEVSKKLNKTFEGAFSVKSIVKLAKKKKIELKLCQTIDEILNKNYSTKEIKEKITKAIIS